MIATTQIPKPKTNLANVLRKLIVSPGLSEREMNINSFRTRISDLRLKYDLNIRHVTKESKNQFGHKVLYRVHFLRDSDKRKALRVYKEINK